MKSPKHRARGQRPCPEWHADDGVAAGRSSSRKSFHRNKPDRKCLQLCGQVRRTLMYALAGACGGDPLLHDLVVESVEPAPDATRLRVAVYSPSAAAVAANAVVIAERLNRIKGRLRREVAAAVVRKRAPDLVFHVLAASGGRGEVTP